MQLTSTVADAFSPPRKMRLVALLHEQTGIEPERPRPVGDDELFEVLLVDGLRVRVGRPRFRSGECLLPRLVGRGGRVAREDPAAALRGALRRPVVPLMVDGLSHYAWTFGREVGTQSPIASVLPYAPREAYGSRTVYGQANYHMAALRAANL
jgi:hypothetical protein